MAVTVHEKTLQITKIKEHIGAIATGVDLTQPIDEATRQQLYDAAVNHVALVIRGQQLTAKQYEQAASLFGELMEDQNRMYEWGQTTLINNRSRVYKGGSWRDRAYWTVPGTRRHLDERQAKSTLGFRCAMDRVGSPTGLVQN